MKIIIHYCWFGGKELPPKLKKYITSWKEFFPNSNIIRWDESNFDVRCNKYVEEAYQSEKWAFVADYCRFWALEKYGGLYFDTDVEVIRNMDNLLELEAFAGFETDEYIAPGLVLYAKHPNNPIIVATREWYDNARFLDEEGNRIRLNVCAIFTRILQQYGFIANGQQQVCGGMTLFPKDYFCPFNDATGVLTKTKNTYTIHWYDKSWMSKGRIFRNKCTRILHRFFGIDIKDKLRGAFHGERKD